MWFYWVWILPVLTLILMILQRWDANGKIDIFSKWLGPPVNMYQFVKGPVIDEQRLQLAQTPDEDIPMLNI